MKKFLAVLLSFTLGMVIGWPTPKPEKYVDVITQVMPTTVTVHVRISRINPDTGRKQFAGGTGSGVFISPNGHVLTAAHVVTFPYKLESISIECTNGWIYAGEVLLKDEHRDLALLKINETNTPYARLVNLKSLQVGQEVIAVGSPLGFAGTVTTGIISALNRDQINYDMIQMSAPINPGNSGGPLFNLKGELVGINTCIVSPNPFFPSWCGLGFAVSANEINKFLTVFRGLEKAIR